METRKKSKPLMEKKRRARINSSLSELKSLLQDVIKEEGARHNKMEKADILEMTVRYLRRVQQQRCTGRTTNLSKYRLGFNECISEIGKFLKTSDNVDPDVHAKVLDHLVNQSFEKDSTNENEDDNLPSTSDVNNNNGNKSSRLHNDKIHERSCESYGRGVNTAGKATIVSPQVTPTNENAQNLICTNQTQMPFQVYNTSQQHVSQVIQTVPQSNIVSGVQLIPTSLVSGQVALIVPANPVQTGPVVNCVVANQPQMTSQTHITNQVANQTQNLECFPVPSTISYNSPQTFTPVTLSNMASCENKSMAPSIGNTSCANRPTVINGPKPMTGQLMSYPLIAPKPISDVNREFCKTNSPDVQNVWRPW